MRTVAITLYPGFQPLDVVGPFDVFTGANEAMDELGLDGDRYDVRLLGREEHVPSENGLTIGATHSYYCCSSIDTIVVPGGDTARSGDRHGELAAWLRTHAKNVRRTTAVCTGTFLLADAGLLDGRRVTTHWSFAGQLARRYPQLIVDPDPIFIDSGDIWTSAGVTAGIDLSLALVEEDCGAEVAQLVARHLVMYLRRPGGQTQFATPVWSESTELEPVRDACSYIHSAIGDDLTVAALASHVGMSGRHFTRVFRSEVGESPARYVERVRVEAARSILETERTGLDAVAQRTGFASAEVLRRAFHRRLGTSPSAYRRHASLTAR